MVTIYENYSKIANKFDKVLCNEIQNIDNDIFSNIVA